MVISVVKGEQGLTDFPLVTPVTSGHVDRDVDTELIQYVLDIVLEVIMHSILPHSLERLNPAECSHAVMGVETIE